MKQILAVVLLAVPLGQASLFEGEWSTGALPRPTFMNKGVVPFLSGPEISGDRRGTESAIKFSVTADAVKITHLWIYSDGPSRVVELEEVLQTDGNPHPSTLDADWTVVAKWSNRSSLDVAFTSRAGMVSITYSLSADRKILIRRRGHGWHGFVNEQIFYR